ncbi:MAG: Hsp20/alpha crystallin family protein [Leptospiraceae bacterium]|nr:Hsp20/alpha crystallin family protein [Leptospiraceae bacterium]MCP5500907.1 Hsp20/alpha crystallin family protein [Leptospiraceae bacterium]
MRLKDLILWNKDNKELKENSRPLSLFDREFDRLMNGFFSDFHFPVERNETWGKTFQPSINIMENEAEIRIEAELPGLTEKDIEVNLEKNVLSISGEKRIEKKDEKENYRLIESSYGKFCRRIELPDGVNQEGIEAEFKGGLMTIRVPRIEVAKQDIKKIEVKKVE